MKLLGGRWSKGDAIAGVTLVVAIIALIAAVLAIPGMPRILALDQEKSVNLTASWDETVGGVEGGVVLIHQVGATVSGYHAALGPALGGRNLWGQGEVLFFKGTLTGRHVEGEMYLTPLQYDLFNCPKLPRIAQALPFVLDLQRDGSLKGTYSIPGIWSNEDSHCVAETKLREARLVRDKNLDANGFPIKK
jgi:hypothetical protein